MSCVISYIVGLFITTIYLINGETINRNDVNDYDAVICKKFPCIINCNVASSCRSTTIQCPIIAGGGNCTINIAKDGSYAAYDSIIKPGTSTNILLNFNGYRSFYKGSLISSNINYNINELKLISKSTQAFEYSKIEFAGNINNLYIYSESISNSYYGYRLCSLLLSGTIINDAIFIIDGDRESFSGSTINIEKINGNLKFLTMGTRGKAFYNTKIEITDGVNGNVQFIDTTEGTDGHSFGINKILIGNIGGNLDIIDKSNIGHSFYNKEIITGNIGGHVIIRDDTYSSSGGRSFYSTIFKFGNIKKHVEFIENSQYGTSFATLIITIGDIKSYALFQSKINNNKPAFDDTTIIINSVFSDLTFLSNRFGSFSETDAEITNGVGGNITLIDTSTKGHGFCCTGNWKFYGKIGGSIIVRDDTPGALGGRSAYNTNFYIGNVLGNIEFIENSEYGSSFVSTVFKIGDVNGNVLFQSVIDNNRQAFDDSSILINSIGGDLTFLSNTYGSFSETDCKITNGVGGNILLLDTSSKGHGFCCNGDWYFYGKIGGSISIRDETSGNAGGRSLHNADIIIGNVLGNIEFIENSKYGASFVSTTYIIGDVVGNILFQSKIDNGRQAFDDASIIINSVGGNLTFLSNTVGSFSESDVRVTNGVNGNILLLDTSSGGLGFCCNGDWYFYGKIGGDISVRDETSGNSGGRSAYNADFIIGNVLGNVEFIENSLRGESFVSTTYKIGNIGGNLLFESKIDNGKQAFDASTFIIDSVNGDLSFLSNTFGSFSECKTEVINDIGGNIILLDTSSGGLGFYNSDWKFYGDISGSISVRDNTIGTKGGRSVYSTNFIIGNVLGNIEFIENSQYGKSFFQSTYDINYVGGNLLFSSLINTIAKYTFDGSTFNIGHVVGNLSFLSNTLQAFADSKFYIETVQGYTKFIGTSPNGQDFYSSDINIENCKNIIIYTNNANALYNSHNYFGSNVGLIDITIEYGTNSLHSTLFDARYANEIILTCLDNADCGNLDIKCPENNKKNKCRVYCTEKANCENINLYTTNGYCIDASFHCLESDIKSCNIPKTSQVFCIYSETTTYPYGSTSAYCYMDNNMICTDYSKSLCSNEKHCKYIITPKPTTLLPTTSSPTTLIPTTTLKPSTQPTMTPIYKTCGNNNNTITPNIEFIADNKKNNYKIQIDCLCPSKDDTKHISQITYSTKKEFSNIQNEIKDIICPHNNHHTSSSSSYANIYNNKYINNDDNNNNTDNNYYYYFLLLNVFVSAITVLFVIYIYYYYCIQSKKQYKKVSVYNDTELSQ